jgi:hypothetical protein
MIKSPKEFPNLPALFLFDSRIYRNQRFSIYPKHFQILFFSFNIRNSNWFSRHLFFRCGYASATIQRMI